MGEEGGLGAGAAFVIDRAVGFAMNEVAENDRFTAAISGLNLEAANETSTQPERRIASVLRTDQATNALAAPPTSETNVLADITSLRKR